MRGAAKTWHLLPHDRGAIERLGREARVSPVVAQLLLNRGAVELCQGDTRTAIELFEAGRARAESTGEGLLAARCADAEALARLDLGDNERALSLAVKAAEAAATAGSPELSRTANGTIALIYLRMGKIGEATTAANAAATFGRSRRALGAFALQGIAAIRRGKPVEAQSAFLKAHNQATELLQKEKNNYQILETKVLVLAGLILCGDHDELGGAEQAYRDARRKTNAAGAVRLCVQKLN